MRALAIRRALRAGVLAAGMLLVCAGCGSDSGTGPNDIPRSDTPPELVGEWLFGVISPTDYHDASSGQWIDNAYGLSVHFEFTGGGRYTQAILIHSYIGSCRTQIYVYNEGTSVVDGSTIRVYPTKGRIRSKDSCNEQYNYDRPDDLAAKQGDTYLWSLEENPNDGKTYLMIRFPEEEGVSAFRRAD